MDALDHRSIKILSTVLFGGLLVAFGQNCSRTEPTSLVSDQPVFSRSVASDQKPNLILNPNSKPTSNLTSKIASNLALKFTPKAIDPSDLEDRANGKAYLRLAKGRCTDGERVEERIEIFGKKAHLTRVNCEDLPESRWTSVAVKFSSNDPGQFIFSGKVYTDGSRYGIETPSRPKRL